MGGVRYVSHAVVGETVTRYISPGETEKRPNMEGRKNNEVGEGARRVCVRRVCVRGRERERERESEGERKRERTR